MSNTDDAMAGPTESNAGGFVFMDTGRLVDNELELVEPEERWIDDVLAACRHPLTQAEDVEHAGTTRLQLVQSVRAVPRGRDAGGGRVPTYNFWMRLLPEFGPPVAMAGSISLRVGQTADVLRHFGHIGYNVYPPARGRGYASRACRMLFGLARGHGMSCLWVTVDPENMPSRRTCEKLGGVLVDVIDVPRDHILYQRGQKRKCRYRIDL